MHSNLFESVPDYEISDYSLERLRNLRLSFDFMGDSLAMAILKTRETEGDSAIMDIMHQNNLDYTLMACINSEVAHIDRKKAHEMNAIIIEYFYDSVLSDISRCGISLIWRSIGMRDEEVKKKAVRELIADIDLVNNPPDHLSELSFTIYGTTISIVDGKNIQEIESPYFPYADTRFLLDEREDRRAMSSRIVEIAGKEDYHDILFTWLMPLCHRAYIDNHKPSKIVERASEIIEGLADGYGILDEKSRGIFKRRCLAHIAIGFDGLMREIKMTREDVIPLSDHVIDKLPSNAMDFIKRSPAAFISDGDYESTALNDKESLAGKGIFMGIDEYMAEEENGLFHDISLLGIHAKHDPSLLYEAIRHPKWMTVPSIILKKTDMVVSHSSDTAFDIDIEIAILRREGMGLTTHPLPIRQRSRDEQEQIVSTLSEEGLFTVAVYNMTRPESDILMKYKDKIPHSLRRTAFESDLGI